MGSGRTAPPPPPGAWLRHPRAGPRRAEPCFLLAASLRAAPPLLRLRRRPPAPGWPDPAAHHPSGGSSRSAVALGSPPLPCSLSAHLPGLLGSPGWALRRGRKRLGSPRRRVSPPPPCGGGRGSRLGGPRSG